MHTSHSEGSNITSCKEILKLFRKLHIFSVTQSKADLFRRMIVKFVQKMLITFAALVHVFPCIYFSGSVTIKMFSFHLRVCAVRATVHVNFGIKSNSDSFSANQSNDSNSPLFFSFCPLCLDK